MQKKNITSPPLNYIFQNMSLFSNNGFHICSKRFRFSGFLSLTCFSISFYYMFLFKTLRSNDAFICFIRVILDLVDSHLWIIASLNGRPCIRRSDFKVCLWILSIFWAQNLSVSLNMSWFFFEILVKTFIHEDLIQFKIQPKFS